MRLLTTMFYIMISIFAMTFISFSILLAVQMYRDKLSLRDLHSIMRVIGGTERIMLPNAAYERYQHYAQDEEKAYEELERNRGLPETRVPPVLRAQEAQAALQGQLDVQTKLLDEQKSIIENLRVSVEAEKRQVQTLQQALHNEREKAAIVERDAATAKLRKTLTEMDAGDVALFLSEVIRDPSQGGPAEAARIIRTHLKADYSAEVLGEMPAPERQRILPLLENRFAGVPPDAVVRIFADQKMGPGEMLAYMVQMNPSQAMGVYLRLPVSAQEQISPQLLRNN